jgi:hypothetical protein
VLGPPLAAFENVDVAVTVLQRGDARRALIIPTAGAAATGLVPGRYRLTLSIHRRRWETTEPEDAVNAYRGTRTLSLQL